MQCRCECEVRDGVSCSCKFPDGAVVSSGKQHTRNCLYTALCWVTRVNVKVTHVRSTGVDVANAPGLAMYLMHVKYGHDRAVRV